MADEADLTDARLAREMERLLALRRAPGPAPTGFCLWCGMVVTGGRRWCDAKCRDDWERAHAKNRR
ncbi:MAG: hypothetical protein N2690_12860 [Rhodocyclaceae bacterium]|nr:hypothetical protein [Rhodocyclaceae bacterium]